MKRIHLIKEDEDNKWQISVNTEKAAEIVKAEIPNLVRVSWLRSFLFKHFNRRAY